MNVRFSKPSPGVPRKVPAEISEARIEASTAHHGRLRSPRAKVLIRFCPRAATKPIVTMVAK